MTNSKAKNGSMSTKGFTDVERTAPYRKWPAKEVVANDRSARARGRALKRQQELQAEFEAAMAVDTTAPREGHHSLGVQ